VISAAKDLNSNAGYEQSSSSKLKATINDRKSNNKRILVSKFFYHLSKSGPKKTLNYVSNYLKGK